MAMLIDLHEAKAWLSETKIDLNELDDVFVDQLQSEILGRLSSVYQTSSWLTPSTTPTIIRKIISMRYVGWLYLRSFSEEAVENAYGMRLLIEADDLLNDATSGQLPIEGIDGVIITPDMSYGVITFEPSDDTEPVFSMSQVF